MTGAISLMYHDVIDRDSVDASGFPGPGAALYKITPVDFRRHLNAIQEARVISSTTDRLDEWTGTQLLFTFDDGGVTFYDPVAPMLEEYGWRGHFFISTDYIGKREFLTAGQIRELRERGHVIGSHSCSHPTRMASCSPEQLRREWRGSIDVLQSILGEAVTTASVPGGYYSRTVGEMAVEAGIRVLFNSEPETRAQVLGNGIVLGRYTVQAGMTDVECAALAAGNIWPALRQKSLWAVKKAAKAVGGTAYLRIQEQLLNRYGSHKSS
jgi:peptidoglycan/xylan/chitin deacetylase (PgdA/CDA1 family)